MQTYGVFIPELRLLNNTKHCLTHLCGLVVSIPGYRSRGPGFDSRRYHIFWEAVGLERGPLSLVSTNEELPGRNSSGSRLENREYGRGDPLCWPCDTFYPQKLTLTSPERGGRSVGIVRLLTKATSIVLHTIWLYRTVFPTMTFSPASCNSLPLWFKY
jgi:hypothetical protein